ncbi:hypothetical protein WN51_03404 [Melipona quadrifasciata]|uniref:Uncharacterized protein n=1 Tax=Melipona quadrifasciata TaxID=166423 RepID=A0A0M8ZXP3_9HYME|nr:hypothetical protein WN51_03404 [Melipona quadrifasciata]
MKRIKRFFFDRSMNKRVSELFHHANFMFFSRNEFGNFEIPQHTQKIRFRSPRKMHGLFIYLVCAISNKGRRKKAKRANFNGTQRPRIQLRVPNSDQQKTQK